MKSIYTILIFFCIVLFVGCTDEDIVKQQNEVQVSASLVQTRAIYEENNNMINCLWTKGERIGLITDKQSNLQYVSQTRNATTATFTPASESLLNEEGGKVYAYSPYSESANGIEVTLPSLYHQTYFENRSSVDFLYASGTITNSTLPLHFEHLFAFLKLTVPVDWFPASGKGGLCISSTHPLANKKGTFNLETGTIGDEELEMKTQLYYHITSGFQEREITCYIAIFPQPGDVNIDIWTFDENLTLQPKMVKKTPSEGFEAGKVYSLTIKDDRRALVELYNAMNGNAWTKNTNWCTDSPISQWYGVNVDDNGRVKYLNLFQNNLEGELPESFGELTQMQYLNFSGNKIRGTLPESMSNLTQLEDINLSSNELSGEFPEVLTHFLDVPAGNLRLERNYFIKPIPNVILEHEGWNKHWLSFISQKEFLDTDVSQYNITAPDFSVTDLEGNIISSATEYGSNLTIFYAWNGKENSTVRDCLKPLYEAYKDGGLNIIGYNKVGNETNVTDFKNNVAANNIPWKTFASWQGKNWIPELTAYSVSTPYYFVVDKNRRVLCHGQKIDKSELDALIIENAMPLYTSTDYSKDGEVFTIQEATVGKGIDLIFMGERFSDRDMESGGKYEQRMKEAVEQLFSIEPYTTLRNRFNVYGIKVISPNDVFVAGAEGRFYRNRYLAYEYARNIPNLRHTMITVIYNTDNYVERSACALTGPGAFVAWITEGLRPEVVNHEVGGHGIALLGDEYVEPGYEALTISGNDKRYLDEYSTYAWGWFANVDYRNDPSTVRWAHFLNDNRYKNEVGIYEGAYLYGKGAYRPSDNSMMRSNIPWFNAPSRELIYKAVMTLSEGEDWVYNYDDFVKFDEPFRGTMPATRSISYEERKLIQERHCPPVIVKDDFNQGKERIVVPLR